MLDKIKSQVVYSMILMLKTKPRFSYLCSLKTCCLETDFLAKCDVFEETIVLCNDSSFITDI